MTMTKRAHNAGSDKEDTSHTGNGKTCINKTGNDKEDTSHIGNDKTCINKTGSDNGVRYKS